MPDASYDYYHQERHQENGEEYAVSSFSSLALILMLMMMMMMMFRTVLSSFFLAPSLLFFANSFFYITQSKKKKDRHFFEGRQDVLASATIRIEQRSSNVPFFSLSSPSTPPLLLLLRFPIFLSPSLFLFALFLLSILFTIACIILLYAYFQGSLSPFFPFSFVQFFLTHSLEFAKKTPSTTENEKKTMETKSRVV